MGWLDIFRKDSAAGSAIAFVSAGQPKFTPDRYDRLADEGYVKNIIAFRCVREIARCAAAVPWILTKGDREQLDHPLLKLLARPNPLTGGAALMRDFIAFYQIAGNSYLETVGTEKQVEELWVLRPDRMKVVPGKSALPDGYEHEVNGVKTRWDVDPISGRSDILHFKDFNPLNDWYGASPLRTAASHIDQFNAGGDHNAALLQNGARPSGAMVFTETPGEGVVDRVQQMLLDRWQSPKNAGKPMTLGSNVKWEEMSISPRDMDFNNMMLAVARNICAAFNVPHVLVVAGEATFNNRADARLELWENNIIPLLDSIADELNNWLVPRFGDGLLLRPNLDDIPALIPRRKEKWVMIGGAKFLTVNEQREALGYEEIEGGDQLATVPIDDGEAKFETRAIQIGDQNFISDALDDTATRLDTTSMVEQLLDDMVKEFGENMIKEIGRDVAFETTEAVQTFIKDRSLFALDNVDSTTKDALRKTLGKGIKAGDKIEDLRKRVDKVFDTITEGRVKAIAQTEATNAAGFGGVEAMDQAGVEKKRWITTKDGFQRGTHDGLDGQTRDLDKNFTSSSGAAGPHPGALGTAAEDVNCRCAPRPVLEGEKASEFEAFWHRHEEKRQAESSDAETVWIQVFNVQRKAVLKRLAKRA